MAGARLCDQIDLYSLFLRESLPLSPNPLTLPAQCTLLEPLVDEPDDFFPETVVLAQFGRVLFTDDLVLGERFLEVQSDKSLSGEVTDCDTTVIEQK